MNTRSQTLSETRPTPRRGLSRVEAAEHLGVSPSRFDEFVFQGRLPPALTGLNVWDARSLTLEVKGTYNNGPSPHLPASVYVIGFGQYVKIGWASNVGRRLIEIQIGIPETLVLLSTIAGTSKDERNLHRRFAKYRLRGEWFLNEGELAAWIGAGCKWP